MSLPLLRRLLSILLLSGTALSCHQDVHVGYADLLADLVDPLLPTYYPHPMYRLGQASSYDRRSVHPDSTGWFANDDYTNFYRIDSTVGGRKEYVLLDTAGPGAIVRWWMTFAGEGAQKGTLRIYVDGEQTPIVQDSVRRFMEGLGLVSFPLAAAVSPLAHEDQRGYNLYLPIPFAKRIKITLENSAIRQENGKWKPSIYYNINYRLYEPNVLMESFSLHLLTDHSDQLREAERQLLKQNDTSERKTTVFDHTLNPEDSATMGLKGAQAIRAIKLSCSTLRPEALRQTVINIVFDGQCTARVPLGDLAGTGYQWSSARTFFSETDQAGVLWLKWPMPFRQTATITLINFSQDTITWKGEIQTSPYKWQAGRSMYFGASWRDYHNLRSNAILNPGAKDTGYAYQLAKLKGQGVYVGDVITLFNTEDAWWGEGDEQFWIDEEVFPSQFGTGTEDYYGYAWARPEVFDHPFIAQPSGRGNFHPGMTTNLRYRQLDALPFQDSLHGQLECLHWVATPMDFSLVSLYYGLPGLSDEISQDIKVQRPLALTKEDLLPPWPDTTGVWEGEHLKVSSADGTVETQYFWPKSTPLSNGGHLWLQAERLGQTTFLDFWARREDQVNLELSLTKAADYAVIDVMVNESQTIRFNGYQSQGIGRASVVIPKVKLKAGVNTLKITMVGKDPKARPGWMAGIDYLKMMSRSG